MIEYMNTLAERATATEVERVQWMQRFQFMKSVSYLLLALLSICSFVSAQEKGKSSPGASIFKGKCVLCHGADGAGNTVLGKQLQAADLRSKDIQNRPDTELTKTVHDGKANMPPFADQLSDEQISQVIKYVRELGKAPPKKTAKKESPGQ